MSARKPSDLIRGLATVASLPAIYVRLSRVVSDPRSTSDDAARVIAEDPGLTLRLLRVVNSAFYGFAQRIETVSQAVRVVGTAQLLDLALATAVLRLFRHVPADLADMTAFWRHSLGCGIGARVLATHMREPNVERYFVAGLLHDIGRPVMYLQAPAESRRALERSRESGELLFRVEREIFEWDHAAVGDALLEAWKLPPALRAAVAHHHNPAQAREHALEAAVVHVADIFANALGMGSSGERFVPPLVGAAWDCLGLPAAELPNYLGSAEKQFDSLAADILTESVT